MEIGIVVVTYNRLECLRKNISCLENLVVPESYNLNIVIVNNNSSDGTTEWLSNLKKTDGFNIINLSENTGGSGGFYTGVKWCADNNIDYIWGMDDDAYPKSDSLVELIKAVDKYGTDCCYWSNCNNDISFDDEVKSVRTWMFVGFFIPSTIVKKVGLPKSDYFIYHDDSEYAYRIIKNGFKILKCRDSVIEHKDGISNYYYGKKLLWRKIDNYSILPDWKRYYDIRNMCLMYPVEDINYWKTIVTYYPKVFIAACLYNPKQLKIIITAMIHGITRKSGIYNGLIN